MASAADREHLQGFECPLCLDVFKDATLLSCGHTFCKECLEAYDEQHNDLDHIVCPVCRKKTHLGQYRVSGLTPNFSLKGLENELYEAEQNRSLGYCPLHKQVYKDIFCEVCFKFICLSCYFDNHKDHKILKKEELESDQKKKRDIFLHTIRTRKTHIEKCMIEAKQKRNSIHFHLANLERQIRDAFATKVTILQENEEILLAKVDNIRKDYDKQLQCSIDDLRKSIDSINNSITVMTGSTGNDCEDTHEAHRLHYSDLENYLANVIDDESSLYNTLTAGSEWFIPADEKLLALGHIELGMTESTIQHLQTATGVNRKEEDSPGSSQLESIPVAVGHSLINIVRQVDLPNIMRGMSALHHDAVVVGYGGRRYGSDCFYMSGNQKQHLDIGVGNVYDLALLRDYRPVASHGMDTCQVYNTHGKCTTGMTYTCKVGGYPTLCSDQHDDIYAVNGNPEIYIFYGSNPNPQTVVRTGDIKPRQISVSRAGVMITSSCDTTPSTVTVFDTEGHVGSFITASDDNEYLYAAVDSQDRVLVARVRRESDVFRLTRYTLQGTKLIEQTAFQELKLPCAIATLCSYCYMTSLAIDMLALANHTKLYFIELPV